MSQPIATPATTSDETIFRRFEKVSFINPKGTYHAAAIRPQGKEFRREDYDDISKRWSFGELAISGRPVK